MRTFLVFVVVFLVIKNVLGDKGITAKEEALVNKIRKVKRSGKYISVCCCIAGN